MNSRYPMRQVAIVEMFRLTSVVKVAELLPLSGHIGQSIQHAEAGEKQQERALPLH
jgi:hypothetical protein